MERNEKIEKRALKAIAEGRILKIVFEPSGEILWVVYGRKFKNMYLVIPGIFCTCKGFTMNVLLRKTSKFCYHLRARDLAEERKAYVVKKMKDSEKIGFLKDIFLQLLVT